MKKLSLCLMMLCFALISSTACFAAPILTIESETIVVGQTTTIDVILSGNPTSFGTNAASGFDFRIPFNDSNFTASSVGAGSALTGLSGANFADASTPGNIIAFFYRSVANASAIPNGVVAHFDVTGVTAGVYPLIFAAGSLTDFSGDEVIAYSLANGTLTVNAVPIPAAAWLLGSGVIGLVALKRRKRA